MDMLMSVLLAGVLAGATLPRLHDQALRSRRADAWASMATLELAQERHRMDKGRYAVNLWELGIDSSSAAGHYELGVVFGSSTGYRIAAQARADSAQSADVDCLHLALERNGSEVHRLAGPSAQAAALDIARRCWPG